MREESPLIMFTSLAQMGAGIAAVHPLLWLVTGKFIWPGWIEVAAVALLLLAGMVSSLAHLGRKKRMLFVLFRINQSPLSLELLLAGITFAAALATFLWYRTVPFFGWRVTIVAALMLLLVMGLVYRLGGQLSWKGAAVVTPLITGMLWGSVFLLVVETAASDNAGLLVYLLITIDVLLTTVRWRTIEHSGRYVQPRFAAAFEDRRKLIITRLIVTDLLTLSALLLIGPVVALITVTAGVFMDRYIFYALEVVHTTEAEISRVESFISDL